MGPRDDDTPGAPGSPGGSKPSWKDLQFEDFLSKLHPAASPAPDGTGAPAPSEAADPPSGTPQWIDSTLTAGSPQPSPAAEDAAASETLWTTKSSAGSQGEGPQILFRSATPASTPVAGFPPAPRGGGPNEPSPVPAGPWPNTAFAPAPQSGGAGGTQDHYTLHDLFRVMLKMEASDLHLAVGSPPILRIKGDLVPSDLPILTDERARELCLPLLSDDQRVAFGNSGDLDMSYEMPGVARFRINVFQQHHGMAAVLRHIPTRIPLMDELGLPPVVKSLTTLRKGLVIVTGPTGSGKSTTLASVINHINHFRNAHIITIEDPLEFVHESKMCLITHREVGTHASSFADALRAATREDPDIILVGEMRDLETISQAIKAAETGMLVFATLHTNSAPKTVDRIIDVFPPQQQDQIRAMLSDSLRAVIAQQIMKTADGRGRCIAVEVLIGTPGLSNIIREGKTAQIPSIIQTGRELGMQSMDQALIDLVKAGKIAPQVARERATDYRAFQRAGIIFPEG